MRKVLSLLLSVLLTGMLYAGGKEQGIAAGSKSTTIQFWNAFTGSDGDVLRELINNYNKNNKDGITVEMDIMPNATLAEKYPIAVQTRTAPAMALFSDADLPMYGKANAFLPIDDFFTATGSNKDDILPAFLDAFMYKGKLMMIPFEGVPLGLYWNKDLFRAVGLDPEKPPTSWDTIEQYAAKITDSSRKIYGYTIPINYSCGYYIAQFWSNGGDFYDPSTMKSVLDSPANLKTLQWMQNMANKGYTPRGATGPDTENLMNAGQVGMTISGPWMINGLKENNINYGFTGMPRGSASQTGLIEVVGFAVAAGTSDAHKAAAYKVIAYMSMDQASQKTWCLKAGFPPYLKSLSRDPDIQGNTMLKTFAEIFTYSKPFGTGLTTIRQIKDNVILPMMENVIAGANPQAELTAASKKIDALLATE
jgi:multiple sugar transport system substrate-binding protein